MTLNTVFSVLYQKLPSYMIIWLFGVFFVFFFHAFVVNACRAGHFGQRFLQRNSLQRNSWNGR
jgi:hypothetical protein